MYSTCSIHAVENEKVVSAALRSEEAIKGGYKLAHRADVLPKWPRRGNIEEMDSSGVVNTLHIGTLCYSLHGQNWRPASFVVARVKMQRMGFSYPASLSKLVNLLRPKAQNASTTFRTITKINHQRRRERRKNGLQIQSPGPLDRTCYLGSESVD